MFANGHFVSDVFLRIAYIESRVYHRASRRQMVKHSLVLMRCMD